MTTKDCESVQVRPIPPHEGVIIRKLRIAKGLSVRQLASLSGMSAANLSRFERGEQDTSRANLQQIVTALELDWNAFLMACVVVGATA